MKTIKKVFKRGAEITGRIFMMPLYMATGIVAMILCIFVNIYDIIRL